MARGGQCPTRILVGLQVPPKIQTGWLLPCHSCTVQPASVLLHLLFQVATKFFLNDKDQVGLLIIGRAPRSKSASEPQTTIVLFYESRLNYLSTAKLLHG